MFHHCALVSHHSNIPRIGFYYSQASNLIAGGSELLLLIKRLRNVVGSVVLPVLGAVPDGAIVLFSGLRENAQEEVAIGVGALAGSTIFLLTIPWFFAILAGRVNIRADGRSTYMYKPRLWPHGFISLKRTGVEPKGHVREAGRYMLITCVSYLVIQGMALKAGNYFSATQTPETTAKTAMQEHGAAMVVLFVCVALFAFYIWTQFTETPEKDEYRDSVVERVIVQTIGDKAISLSGAFDEVGQLVLANERTSLVNDQQQKRLKNVLKTFFKEYDRDESGYIDEAELSHLMADLGERLNKNDLKNLREWIDYNDDGKISLTEFMYAIPRFIKHRVTQAPLSPPPLQPIVSLEEGGRTHPMLTTSTRGPTPVEDSDEEEPVPEDLRCDDPDAERLRILMRSFRMMIFGTILVLIFSDPTVAVMQDIAERVGISGFYVSFLVAPLASNLSEVVAAYSYAQKKTRRTITVSFSTLLGAAILNNTFVLGIFMLLIVAKGLAWQFTAETVAILLVELVLGVMSQKRIHTLRDGLVILALFPLSLLVVFVLESVLGLD